MPGICAIGADYSDGWVGFSLWMRGEEAHEEYDAMETKVLELVTLATGERASLALDDSRAILLQQPVWVTDTEVGISGRWDGAPTLFRLSLDRAEPLN